MSLGVWSLTVFSLLLTALVAIAFLNKGSAGLEWVRKLLVVLGLPVAFTSAAYKGVLFSTSAQPFWKDARWLGGYLTNSAFLLGCAELLLISLLADPEGAATTLLRRALGLLLVLNVIHLGLAAATVRTQLLHWYNRQRLWSGILLSIGGGSLLPFCLVLIWRSPLSLSIAVLCIFLASLYLRFAIVRLPHVAR
jgi:hypothetical protein